MPEPIQKHEEKKTPPPPQHDLPPHILKELLEMREKIGRLEGMVEVLLERRNQNKLV